MMMIRRRRSRRSPFGGMTAALILAAFAGLSCAEPDDSGVRGVTDDTIVLGTWSPLTGPVALWGAVGRGAELYFEMINEEGGIHGRKIEFILKDDAYQPSRTVAAVREMVERDRVFAVVAGVGTAPTRAVLDYLKGFAVLGFPANNFMSQEPGSNAEIKEFCSSTFNVKFDMMSKISVKGDDMHPLYKELTSKDANGEHGGDIGWNFTKFLIGKDGKVAARYNTRVNPSSEEVAKAIEAELMK